MAKAVRLYTGNDTFGAAVEVAQRVDGVWFQRFQVNNGRYGYAMCKWHKRIEPVTYPEKYLNQYWVQGEPEYIEIPEENRHLQIDWGFKTLTLSPDCSWVRLPK